MPHTRIKQSPNPGLDLQWYYRWLDSYKKVRGFDTLEWQDFYNTVRDSSWPNCDRFEDLQHLPWAIQQEIFWQHLPHVLAQQQENKFKLTLTADSAAEVQILANQTLKDFYHDDRDLELTHSVNCHGIDVRYHPSMECGGIVRSDLFLQVLDMVASDQQFQHCLEWCSGPGFIGYNLLGAGVCAQLDLADIWQPSLRAAQAVAAPHTARTWHIRRLADIPSTCSYDLIVGNPPWFTGHLMGYVRNTCDPDLNIHRQFFLDAKQRLNPDGMILLCEGQTYVGPRDFQAMLDAAGLEITQVLQCSDRWHWFAVIRHR
jgi:methylase of polypeptide subunit release factors